MWYLIGILITLAYFIIMPLIKHRQYWNSILHTINIEKDLWECMWGHFLTSVIPGTWDYSEYQRDVCDYGHNILVWPALLIIFAICFAWIIVVPILLLVALTCFIKRLVEYYFQQKIKNEKEISNNTQ